MSDSVTVISGACSSAARASQGWSATRVLVVALCFALNMLDGADLLIMSFIAPVLAGQWTISPEQLGVLFSASLAGMAVGCLLVAPLADRFGRRPVLMLALLTVCVAMTASGFATSVAQLGIARLLVGIGVGTIGVTMTAIAAEYAPPRYSSFAAGLVQAGWPAGSVITAFVAAAYLPVMGWETVVIGIGAVSFAFLLAIALLMPESQAFLLRAQPRNALARYNRTAVRLHEAPLAALPSVGAETSRRIGPRTLFRDGRQSTSLLLWIAVGFGYFVLYFAISWIPKLAADAGLALEDAIYAGATYNVGAFLGTSLMGLLAIRYRLNRVIAGFFACAIVALLMFGGLRLPVLPTLLIAALVGVTVQGGFNGFWALAARLYPAEMRGTGIGWALGVGRIGAVLGPVMGGVLLGAHIPVPLIFAVFAGAAAIAGALCLFIGGSGVEPDNTTADAAPHRG